MLRVTRDIRFAVACGVCGVLAIVALNLSGWPSAHHRKASTATHEEKAASTTAGRTVSTVQTHPQKARGAIARHPSRSQRTITVSIAATRGPSRVLIRRDSSDGPLIIEDTLPQGRVMSIAGSKLFVRFSAIDNVDVQIGRVGIDLTCYARTGVLLTADGPTPRPSAACLSSLGS